MELEAVSVVSGAVIQHVSDRFVYVRTDRATRRQRLAATVHAVVEVRSVQAYPSPQHSSASGFAKDVGARLRGQRRWWEVSFVGPAVRTVFELLNLARQGNNMQARGEVTGVREVPLGLDLLEPTTEGDTSLGSAPRGGADILLFEKTSDRMRGREDSTAVSESESRLLVSHFGTGNAGFNKHSQAVGIYRQA